MPDPETRHTETLHEDAERLVEDLQREGFVDDARVVAALRAENARLATLAAIVEAKEPVAWALTYSGELIRDAVFQFRDEAEQELARRNAAYPAWSEERGIIALATLEAKP